MDIDRIYGEFGGDRTILICILQKGELTCEDLEGEKEELRISRDFLICNFFCYLTPIFVAEKKR